MNEFKHLFKNIDETDPFKLSYGQKKLFISIIIYLLEPELLILDEPFANLDSENSYIIEQIITSHLSNGNSIILTSHNDDFISKYTNQIFKIDK